MHIKSCHVAKDKAHTTRYQEFQNYKHARKGVLHDYSEKVKASITSLQNKSPAAIESTIYRSSKSITSSNDKFYAAEKPEITDELVSFDEVILLELRWMVDSMAADDLLCRLVMGDIIIF